MNTAWPSAQYFVRFGSRAPNSGYDCLRRLADIASAVGTPAVGLFGPTDGRRRGPYGSDHRIIQGVFADPSKLPSGDGPSAPSVMDQIRVEDVLASIEAAL